MNWVLAIIILALGFVLAVVSHLVIKRELSAARILLYGLGCTLFGLVTQCLFHRDCIAVLLLQETSGFGRAYVAGLSIVASTPFVLILRCFFSKRKRKD